MRVEREYDVAPQVLLDVLTDEAFLAHRGARFGGSEPAKLDRSADRVVIVVVRQLPVEAVPSPFRRFVGTGRLEQTDTWDITAPPVTGTWTADVGSSPVSLHGTHEITATTDGCRYVVTAEVKVRLPIGGRMAESLVSQRLTELVRAEQEFAADWLAREVE
jgi:hypothetical protein